jgi:hypothetical protein
METIRALALLPATFFCVSGKADAVTMASFELGPEQQFRDGRREEKAVNSLVRTSMRLVRGCKCLSSPPVNAAAPPRLAGRRQRAADTACPT